MVDKKETFLEISDRSMVKLCVHMLMAAELPKTNVTDLLQTLLIKVDDKKDEAPNLLQLYPAILPNGNFFNNFAAYLGENPIDAEPILAQVLCWCLCRFSASPDLAGLLSEIGWEVLAMVCRLEFLDEFKIAGDWKVDS